MAGALLLASAQARAQSPEIAVAQALFDEARALSEQGRFQEACPKLEESQRLDPGTGTQLNLADCHEHTGKLATAWALFLEVESSARRNGDERRASFARARSVALAPRLSRLRLVVAPQPADLAISRDQVALGKAQWGVALPVDPGHYVITARAAGYESWSTQIDVKEPAQEIVVQVPALALSPSTAAPGPRWTAREQLAAGLAIGGTLALGTGAYLALAARQKYRAAAPGCDGGCDDASFDQRTDAIKQGNVATIVGGAGLLLGGAAAYLWVTRGSPAEKPSAMTWVAPAIGRGSTGLVAQGHF